MNVGDRIRLLDLEPGDAELLALEHHAKRLLPRSGLDVVPVTVFPVDHRCRVELDVISVDEIGDLLARCGECEASYWVSPAWVATRPLRPVCVCSNVVHTGCVCGAFEAEQLARGLVRNPWTRLWESREPAGPGR